jgi:hypothetical protein
MRAAILLLHEESLVASSVTEDLETLQRLTIARYYPL